MHESFRRLRSCCQSIRGMTDRNVDCVMTNHNEDKTKKWEGSKLFPIECFHSRGQHLCKFIGTKESVCIRKEFNSHRIGLGHQHGRRFIV